MVTWSRGRVGMSVFVWRLRNFTFITFFYASHVPVLFR